MRNLVAAVPGTSTGLWKSAVGKASTCTQPGGVHADPITTTRTIGSSSSIVMLSGGRCSWSTPIELIGFISTPWNSMPFR